MPISERLLGSFCIGSTSTHYNGDATVILSGAAAPGNLGTDNFGTKVIGVAAGATFGLHGQVSLITMRTHLTSFASLRPHGLASVQVHCATFILTEDPRPSALPTRSIGPRRT